MRAAIIAFCFLALASIAIPPSACASSWQVDPAASHVRFGFTQMGSRLEGSFERFESEIVFDADDLASASVRTTIEIESVSTGNAERDAGMLASTWFDVANHPRATFASSRFVAKGGDGYDVEGTLVIRGTEQAVVLPMTIRIGGDRAEASGKLVLDRRDFALGQGDWASDSIVGYEVPVDILISARKP
ncbi:MAG: YceI family protein [Geminicoccaceae bacterium]